MQTKDIRIIMAHAYQAVILLLGMDDKRAYSYTRIVSSDPPSYAGTAQVNRHVSVSRPLESLSRTIDVCTPCEEPSQARNFLSY